MIQQKEWEKFYSDNLATEWYPSEAVVRLLCTYKKQSGSEGKKVLDLGCGNGRHVWLAAKEGFLAYGIDLSQKAVDLCKSWLERDGLKCVDLRSGNIAGGLPYADDFFDIVISYGVLDHIRIGDAETALTEVRRILKPGGVLFLKLESNTSFTFEPDRQISKNEVILTKPVEYGMIQHFFDKEEVATLTKNFTPIKMFREDLRRFEDLDKNYQSRWIFIGTNP